MSNFFSKAESNIECHLLSAVDPEPEDHHHFSLLTLGLLILTTHRLIWLPSSSVSAIPLAAISHIFLN
uniref:Uncharacterized protein n=1 Tax=Gossypium raimondii TaxID=29730 RepID=A0A0D2R559_GOSRA|nr:hypothetical protein B456_004G275700 [Gossypium raimondii]